MATWKKVIVSGSNASLNQISASGGINAVLPSNGQPNFVAYDSASGTFQYAGTGSFTAATASYITASNVYGPYGASSILSASYAVTAAFANNIPATASYALQALSASYANFATSASSATTANTASYVLNAVSSSFATNALTASYVLNAVSSSFASTASFVENAQTASYVLNAVSASFASTASLAQTASYVLNAVSASFATSASQAQNASTASYVLNAVSASFATQALTASNANTASNIGPAIENNINNYLLTATGTGSINGESNLTFDGSLLTVNGNATITGDLSVAGTASFTNTENLNIKDKFILINSGSATLADSGWITQYNVSGSGSAFYLEATSTGTYGRFAMAYDAIGAASALTADEYVVSAKQAAGAPSGNPTWGGSGNGFGNIYVDSGNGDNYIYA